MQYILIIMLLKTCWRNLIKNYSTRFEKLPYNRWTNEKSVGLILKNTVVTRCHLTPEIKLRLITPDCEVWYSKSTDSEFPNEPFWGIYWPGGQALGRFILNNPSTFKGKNVLEIGSGSGACAIAAMKAGAKLVVANDIDPLSLTAISINSHMNNVHVQLNQNNLIGEDIDKILIPHDESTKKEQGNFKWDIILIGDMFYDTEFSFKLFRWLCDLAKNGKKVLVGDPGRYALKELTELSHLGRIVNVAEYEFDDIEHNGYPTAAVYELRL